MGAWQVAPGVIAIIAIFTAGGMAREAIGSAYHGGKPKFVNPDYFTKALLYRDGYIKKAYPEEE